jgi:hypothetical protein
VKQATFSSASFDRYAKTTKREIFLAEMDQVVPWPLLCELMAPHYPDSGTGRPPVGLERMDTHPLTNLLDLNVQRLTWTKLYPLRILAEKPYPFR